MAEIKKKIVNFAARRLLQHYTDKQRLARIVLGTPRVDPVVLLPASRNMRLRFEKLFHRKKKDGSVTVAKLGGQQFTICHSGVGAPSTEIILNALIAGGARLVLRCDVCGSLSAELPVGQLFLADSVHAYDGVSTVYAPENINAADEELIRLIRLQCDREKVALTTGRIATVDFFFAQTDEHHRLWAQDAAAVDMETGAIYAISNALGIKAASLMTVSDVKMLGQDPFVNPDYDYAGFRKGLSMLTRVIPGIIRKILLG